MVSRHLWEESCPTCSVQTESETWLLDPAQQTRADIPCRAVSPEVVSRVCRVTRAPRLGGKGMGSCIACSLFGINQSGSASGRCRRLRSTSQLPRTSGVRSFTAGEADDGPDAASFWATRHFASGSVSGQTRSRCLAKRSLLGCPSVAWVWLSSGMRAARCCDEAWLQRGLPCS